MLLPILLAASIQAAPQVSMMRCVDGGANIPTVQTEWLRGPQGLVVVLKFSSADDHSKDTYLCNPECQLFVTPVDRGAALPVDILTTDDDWGANSVPDARWLRARWQESFRCAQGEWSLSAVR